ncbi:MAG: hypothetical protein A2014_02860 [Spirochaetes bacterium GWF1_49_6]|nr:MAG: hypothetical protein A2014_02860 [Spirochaetes bacterium GWF1_49_6]
MILMDTDVCVEILRGNNHVLNRYGKENDSAAISFDTVDELYYGVFRSNRIEQNLLLVERFLLTVPVIQSDSEIMKKFRELKASLSGNIIPDADILIAATALCKCKKLISGNIAHFRRFENLSIENWMK